MCLLLQATPTATHPFGQLAQTVYRLSFGSRLTLQLNLVQVSESILKMAPFRYTHCPQLLQPRPPIADMHLCLSWRWQSALGHYME